MLTGTEREQLEAFLRDNRVELIALLYGLSEEQARRRLVPSSTTLLGLVKHAVFVERIWFDVSLAGRTRAELALPDDAEDSFVLTADETIASVTSQYRQAWADAERTACLLQSLLEPVAVRHLRHLPRQRRHHA